MPCSSSSSLRSFNKTIALDAVKQNADAMQWVDECFTASQDFVLQAMLQGDSPTRVALAAVKQNANAMQWINPEVKCNMIFILQAMAQNGLALEWVPDLITSSDENHTIAVAAIKQNENAIQFVDESIREIVWQQCRREVIKEQDAGYYGKQSK